MWIDNFGIGNYFHRRTVEEDDVVFFASRLNHFCKSLGREKFGWVGRDNTTRENVYTVERSDDFVPIVDLSRKIVGNADFGLTHIVGE